MAVLARVDEVDFEVRWRGLVEGAVREGVGHVPMVDVIGAEVLYMSYEAGERREVGLVIAEGCSLGEEERGLAADRALEDCAAAALVLVEELLKFEAGEEGIC